MKFEVEIKFPVDDLSDVESRIEEMGGIIEVPKRQADKYYSHPCRNFAETDEALRIRRVGDQNFITYKGPKVDDSTKTRREVEVPLVSGATGAANIVAMFESLGFTPVAEVIKDRRKSEFQFEGFEVLVAMDEVLELGKFVELEITAEESDVEAAKAALEKLAIQLGLSDSERRSYLELILGNA
ncbi:class IV adenylate cyclase [Blastopirellula marina]|uniref:Class IV adenylate cyclase n=1 Tax=Blastopirellula marina TaxID=124 RepID=A0A2S8GF13_9BACT|nr:class IV adenylate cyclase [Blastopirellula marina]PQO42841.1 class IV adenylate cyclase [Blastopirellula marina]PTL46607.1 class IV adenylate cyclase [Blastopirellula marina]